MADPHQNQLVNLILKNRLAHLICFNFDGERIGLEDALKVALDVGHKALEIVNWIFVSSLNMVEDKLYLSIHHHIP